MYNHWNSYPKDGGMGGRLVWEVKEMIENETIPEINEAEEPKKPG